MTWRKDARGREAGTEEGMNVTEGRGRGRGTEERVGRAEGRARCPDVTADLAPFVIECGS